MNVNLNGAMYDTIPDVAGLNSVKGFDPRKFMRRAVSEETKQEVYYLDLKFKKLWFRLAHPAGRIKTTVLKITNQLAIIEAKVYYNMNDREPASSFVAQRTVQDKAGTLYIEAAQYAAVDQALCDAGFGLQFCDVSQGSDPELYDSGVPAPAAAAPIPGQLHQPVADANPPETAEELVHDDNPPAAPVVDAVREDDPPAAPVAEIVREDDLPAAPVADAVHDDAPPAAPVAEIVHEDDSPVGPVVDAVQENDTLAAPVPEQMPSGAPVGVVAGTVPAINDTAPIQEHQSSAQEAAADTREEIVGDRATAHYTPDMTVEEIYALMTPEEAAAVISDVGNMAGQTLEAIAQRRPAVLKWYINGCNSGNNILRAGARIMLEQATGQKLAS